MSYGRNHVYWQITSLATIVVFPIALFLYAVSGFDLRRRSDKAACRTGAADRCFALGQYYEARTDGLVATMLSNAVTAQEYYDRACRLGDRPGCARLGHMALVGDYDSMRDSPFSREDGMSALGKACNGGEPSACRELADAEEPAQAAPILAKLCDGGDKESCDKLVKAYWEIDPKRAVEFLTKRCDAGDGERCGELGDAFLSGSKGVDADPAQAATFLTKACDRGGWDGCRDLGEAYLDGKLPADPAHSDALFTRACDHGDMHACFDEGKSLVGRDPARALQVFTTECERGSPIGCDALADLYRLGATGIARDPARARSVYDHTCRGGDDYACHKRDCFDANQDACFKVYEWNKDRYYRLGGRFDMR